MNYFPFNMGDYAAHTGHLEPMEDLAYRRLLDQYYLREGPLPCDIQVTSKLVRMRSMTSDVEAVLREFFVLTEAGWMHERCEQEIAKMQDKQAKARDAAEQSVKSRRAAAERRLAEQEAAAEQALASFATDVQLPTPTPTPTPTPKNRNTSAIAPPEGVSDLIWKDFLKIRAAKKAPMTETALDGIRLEAEKAGISLSEALSTCCTRGWQGFKASWYAKDHGNAAPVGGLLAGAI